MLSAKIDSTATAWSALRFDASALMVPFCNTVTRAPCCPRITGCPTPGPKEALFKPGCRAKVSPMVLPAARCNASPLNTVTGKAVSDVFLCRGTVTSTCSIAGDSPPTAAALTNASTADIRFFMITPNKYGNRWILLGVLGGACRGR